MGAFYTVAKLPVDDAKKFCAWCLSDFRYVDENTAGMKPSGHNLEVKAETIMMALLQDSILLQGQESIKCVWLTFFVRKTCGGRS